MSLLWLAEHLVDAGLTADLGLPGQDGGYVLGVH
jgi:hypothetical protein